jgi:hypothetical protein
MYARLLHFLELIIVSVRPCCRHAYPQHLRQTPYPFLNPVISTANHVDIAHRPDFCKALEVAYLNESDSVLDIGSGNGSFNAAAKKCVSTGFCTAVNALQDLLVVDIPWRLGVENFTVY